MNKKTNSKNRLYKQTAAYISFSTLVVGSLLAISSSPASAQPQNTYEQESILGSLNTFGKKLNASGVNFDITYLDQFNANPNSGVIPNRASQIGVLNFKSDLNLDKILGVPGATVHFVEAVYGLRSGPNMVTESGGSLASLPVVAYNTPNTLSLLTYEQKFYANRISAEFGKTNLLRYFLVHDCVNSFTCNSAILEGPVGDAASPYPTLGGLIRFHLSPHLTLRAGAFQTDFHDVHTNGWRINDHEVSGVIAISSLTYNTNFLSNKYPEHIEFGAFGDSGTFKDPTIRGKINQQPVGIYLFASKTVWRQDGGQGDSLNPESISVYGNWIQTINSHQEITQEGWAGFIYHGLFSSRPYDYYGLGMHYAQLGQREVEYQEAERVNQGGAFTNQSPSTFSFEASGSILLHRGLTLTPDIQYILNADSRINPRHDQAPRDGFFVSVNLIASLAEFANLSSTGS